MAEQQGEDDTTNNADYTPPQDANQHDAGNNGNTWGNNSSYIPYAYTTQLGTGQTQQHQQGTGQMYQGGTTQTQATYQGGTTQTQATYQGGMMQTQGGGYQGGTGKTQGGNNGTQIEIEKLQALQQQTYTQQQHMTNQQQNNTPAGLQRGYQGGTGQTQGGNNGPLDIGLEIEKHQAQLLKPQTQHAQQRTYTQQQHTTSQQQNNTPAGPQDQTQPRSSPQMMKNKQLQ
jgi:hypothetical protein